MSNTIQSRDHPKGFRRMVQWTVLRTKPQRRWQPLRSLPLLERHEVELELQLAQQRLERQQSGSCSRNYLRSSAHFWAEVLLFNISCFIFPYQPPRFLPHSSSFSERAIYFLSSMDFVSHNTESKTFIVSILRIASRIHGIFSSF